MTNATKNLSARQRGIVREIVTRARGRNFSFRPDELAAPTRHGRITRSYGCAVDAGTVGLPRLAGPDRSNMRTFANKYKVTQTFAMGVSDGFENFRRWGTLEEAWDGYGYRGKPSGTERDYRSGLTVGRAVRAIAAV